MPLVRKYKSKAKIISSKPLSRQSRFAWLENVSEVIKKIDIGVAVYATELREWS
jgi:hypothetical protein